MVKVDHLHDVQVPVDEELLLALLALHRRVVKTLRGPVYGQTPLSVFGDDGAVFALEAAVVVAVELAIVDLVQN